MLFLRFLIFNNLKQNWKQFLTLEEQFRSTISSTIKFSRNGIIISGFLFPKSNLPSFVPTGLTVKTWNSPFVLLLELWDDFLQLLTGIPQSRKRCTLFKTYCNIKSMNKPMCLFPLSYIYWKYYMGVENLSPTKRCFPSKGLLSSSVHMKTGLFKRQASEKTPWPGVAELFRVFWASGFIFNAFPWHFQIKILFFKDWKSWKMSMKCLMNIHIW